MFAPIQQKKVVLTRPIWVKGKWLPKNGVQLFHEGDEVIALTDNGIQWYIVGQYQGHEIKIATIFHT